MSLHKQIDSDPDGSHATINQFQYATTEQISVLSVTTGIKSNSHVHLSVQRTDVWPRNYLSLTTKQGTITYTAIQGQQASYQKQITSDNNRVQRHFISR